MKNKNDESLFSNQDHRHIKSVNKINENEFKRMNYKLEINTSPHFIAHF